MGGWQSDRPPASTSDVAPQYEAARCLPVCAAFHTPPCLVSLTCVGRGLSVLLHRLSDPTRTAFPFITTAQQLVRDPARVFGSVVGQGGGLTPAGEGLLDLASPNSTVIVSQVETMQPDLLARLYQLAETGTTRHEEAAKAAGHLA